MSLMKTPITVGGLKLKNRLVMPPMATEKSADGIVTDALCDYYREKTQGGYIGLVVTEHSYILPEGKASPGQLSIARDSDIPGLRKLTDSIHENGSAVFAQISHAGGATRPKVTGTDTFGPSEVLHPFQKRLAPEEQAVPHSMTLQQIQQVVEAFAAAALRAKAAGFDGVVIHGAHGYLLSQFYSPLTNRREDAYGGSPENRIRLHLEVIRAVRAAVGADYPVTIRFGALDHVEGGAELADALVAAKAFKDAGIDLIKISGGLGGWYHEEAGEFGYFTREAGLIRQAVGVPVEVTGGIASGAQAEAVLQAGKADLIGVARPILKDSLWAKTNLDALD